MTQLTDREQLAAAISRWQMEAVHMGASLDFEPDDLADALLASPVLVDSQTVTSALESALRLVSPDHLTPQGLRQIRRAVTQALTPYPYPRNNS